MDDKEMLRQEFESTKLDPVSADTRVERGVEENAYNHDPADSESDDDYQPQPSTRKRYAKKLSLDTSEHSKEETLAIKMLKRLPVKSRKESVVKTLLPQHDPEQVLQAIKKL